MDMPRVCDLIARTYSGKVTKGFYVYSMWFRNGSETISQCSNSSHAPPVMLWWLAPRGNLIGHQSSAPSSTSESRLGGESESTIKVLHFLNTIMSIAFYVLIHQATGYCSLYMHGGPTRSQLTVWARDYTELYWLKWVIYFILALTD